LDWWENPQETLIFHGKCAIPWIFTGFWWGLSRIFPRKAPARLPIDPPIQLAFSNARRVFSREPLIFHEPAPCHAEKIWGLYEYDMNMIFNGITL